jgi:hypothetical protein
MNATYSFKATYTLARKSNNPVTFVVRADQMPLFYIVERGDDGQFEVTATTNGDEMWTTLMGSDEAVVIECIELDIANQLRRSIGIEVVQRGGK